MDWRSWIVACGPRLDKGFGFERGEEVVVGGAIWGWLRTGDWSCSISDAGGVVSCEIILE